ncbi:hypothetical protein ACM66B_003625 [Microbotryomycetes sp. NB124-2]
MRPTQARMGGGARFEYPKTVWTPSGGWWTRPASWKSNTGFVAIGVLFATYGVWQYSAQKEWRHTAPTRPIPSMNSALRGEPPVAHH